MDEKIRWALDGIHVPQSLIHSTQSRISQARLPAPSRIRRAALGVPVLGFALMLFLLVGYGLYSLPAAVISIDVNPSLELQINRWNRVVGVSCFNQDARQVAEEVDLTGLPYDQALVQLLESDAMAPYLEGDPLVSIAVSCSDGKKSLEIQSQIQTCVGKGYGEVQCQISSPQEMEQAHQAGLSMGKYRAYLIWNQLDPTVTPQDAAGLSMRQIKQHIDALSGEDTGALSEGDTACLSGQGNSLGQGQGNGLGQGNGNSHGNSPGQGNGSGQKNQYGKKQGTAMS